VDTCRRRAGEHRRALDLDRVPVEVVVQRVEVEKTAGPELVVRRNGAGWTTALAELSRDPIEVVSTTETSEGWHSS
jgi:hypothetical protein